MKKIIWGLVSILIIAIGIFSYIIIYNVQDKNDENNSADASSVVNTLAEDRTEVQGTITQENLEQYKKEGLNPFGKTTSIEESTIYHYNEYIHGMSHQKVKAEEKWGYYEIHPERIQWLLEGLDVVEINNETVYRKILERWAEGDFSKVDDDHNAIWTLQGGTIGEATGILSPEEEQAYIESKQ
ncbi:DUF6241 domain-containing protein [Oceanobacillus bengalensis]|uniref:Uncharacterized protein n=1 Tax=Oceanobacillus bengalensis TaxID=1435466 RepID=A0A494YSZ3_9BACI|nr:DUF6241 domain-containing protein [Oceanobacillus bengalensis]RKQ13251.1 hypothetical protein D8M05_16835 [Oceanobacillus bengalensis]